MRIVELNHVAIHVEDVEKSCEFYATALKLERMERPAFDFPGAWFRLGGRQELHIIGNRQATVHSHNRGNHFALMTDDLGGWVEHFERVAVVPMRGPVRRPDGAMQVFVRDPDGHVIELFTPPTAAV